MAAPTSLQEASFGKNAHLGPLLLRGQSPLQLPRLSLIPIGAQEVPRGHWLVNTTATWTNRWAWGDGQYLVDGEVLRMAVSATYGITDWLQVRLEIPFSVRAGGAMDGFIEGFHDLFDLTQAGRDHFPRDQYHIKFWRKDGPISELGPSGTHAGFEDILLSSAFRLARGSEWLPQTTFLLHLKFPSGDKQKFFGSGSFDGGVALSLAKRMWRLFTYLDLQYSRFGGDELAGIPLNKDQFSGLFTFEYPWTERLSIIAQYLLNSGAAEDFHEFSNDTHEVTLGVKAEFLPKTIFEFGLIENLFTYENSPDLGLHFGLYRVF